MKPISSLLGLVLLAGCASESEGGCNKGCGKNVAETSMDSKGLSQEVEPTVEKRSSFKLKELHFDGWIGSVMAYFSI